MYCINNILTKKNINLIVQIVYAFSIVYFLPNIFKCFDGLDFSYSVISIALFVVILMSIFSYGMQFYNIKLANKIIYLAVSFTFLLCMVLGKMLDTKGYLQIDIKSIFAPIIVAPYMAMLINSVYSYIYKHGSKIVSGDSEKNPLGKNELIISFVYLMICWGIVLFGVFPGFFVYDAGDELLEVITRQFNTHHPLLHVLYMGGTVQAGYKIFGSYNAGIFCFTLMQMLFFALGVIYAEWKMCAFGFGKKLCRTMIIVMGLFPVFPMFVLCSSKDSIFSLVLLLWVVKSYENIRFPKKHVDVMWIVWSVLMCLLRNNALYAMMPTCFIMFVVWKEHRKRVLQLFVATIGITIIFSSGMKIVLNAKESGHQEILTVPIQQLARIYTLEGDTFSAEEKEKLFSYLPEKYINRYVPKISDGVKIGFDNDAYDKDSAGFWKLWIKGLKSSPVSYLNAWLLTSYGYWYPDTIVDVYKGNTVYTFTYGDNTYFGYETEQPGNRKSYIPVIDSFYNKLSLDIYKEKVPVLSMLFSQGFVLWVMIFAITYILVYGGVRKIMPYLILVMMVLTLLLGPTFLPRYVFFVWLCISFIVGDMFTIHK